MLRIVLGVLVGAIVWVPAFLILARLLLMMWPSYAAAVEAYMTAERYEFTALMAWFHIVFWILAEVLAGWLTSLIARRHVATWVLAAILVAIMGSSHLYILWDRYPWWYNLAVVIPVVPAVLLGARLVGRTILRPVTTVTTAGLFILLSIASAGSRYMEGAMHAPMASPSLGAAHPAKSAYVADARLGCCELRALWVAGILPIRDYYFR